MAILSPSPKLQFFDANGNPLVGGKLYTYAAGTTTPLASYTDSSGGTANTNPIILDSRGEANVWLASGTAYKFVLQSAASATIWTVDNIDATLGTMASQNANNVAITGGSINGTTIGATTASSGAFTTLSATGNVTLGDASTDTLNVGNGGLVKDASGNVGVGVTPSAWTTTAGRKAIEIGAIGNALFGAGSSDISLFSNSYINTSSQLTYANTGPAARYQLPDGTHRWYIAPSGTAGNAITFTQAMTLDASGRLGIGVTSPGFPLDLASVSGESLRIRGTSGTEVSKLLFTSNTAGADYGYLTSASGYLAFGYGASEAARIDSSGNLLVTGSGILGYGTGSGGTVTQTTSRTTGVTLNKTNGQITLVSAAGSTTIQSFTVTNSTVSANDVVVVSQKSGTDLYRTYVTNVAAGSFKISFATLSGTTTEQPVFNFAVFNVSTS